MESFLEACTALLSTRLIQNCPLHLLDKLRMMLDVAVGTGTYDMSLLLKGLDSMIHVTAKLRFVTISYTRVGM